MAAVYAKGVSDSIADGYGSQVQEQTQAAAVSEHLSTVNSFNETTRNEVLAALGTAAVLTDPDGGDVDIALKLALAYSLVKTVFNKLRTKRKRLIVDSAVLGPYNQGLFDSAVEMEKATGRTLTKEWVSLMDERVRNAHKDLHGDRVPVGSPFYVKGVPIRFPKDPLAPPGLTINCRCVLRFGR